jgi:predicted oxidoreductase
MGDTPEIGGDDSRIAGARKYIAGGRSQRAADSRRFLDKTESPVIPVKLKVDEVTLHDIVDRIYG